MKYLFIFLIFVSSCVTNKIIVSDLNTSGKVISISNCKDCEGGKFIYTIELDPIEKSYIKYITSDKYLVGQNIKFKTQIY